MSVLPRVGYPAGDSAGGPAMTGCPIAHIRCEEGEPSCRIRINPSSCGPWQVSTRPSPHGTIARCGFFDDGTDHLSRFTVDPTLAGLEKLSQRLAAVQAPLTAVVEPTSRRAAAIEAAALEWADFWDGHLDLDALAVDVTEHLADLQESRARVERFSSHARQWWEYLYGDDPLILSLPGGARQPVPVSVPTQSQRHRRAVRTSVSISAFGERQSPSD